MYANTLKQVKVLQVIRQSRQHVRKVLLIQLQVIWNVCYISGDVIRKFICTEVRCRGAPDKSVRARIKTTS